MTKKRFAKTRKAVLATLVALTLSCTGVAAACANEKTPEPSSPTVSREDTQLIKNGDFEFFDVPDKAVHLIKSVNDWSRSGDSSGTLSGIINTSAEAWKQISDPELKDKLDNNNKLSSNDPDYDTLYVDYNGMKSTDIPYADTYAAKLSSVTDDDDILSLNFKSYMEYMGVEEDSSSASGYTFNGQPVYKSDVETDKEFFYDAGRTKPIRYTVIDNPETHLGSYDEGTKKLGDTPVYTDENGNYFFDDKLEQPVGNVLMVHNFPTGSTYNGIQQYYSSSSITLEANTAAEISLWVKTSNLKFDKGFSQLDDEDRGAFIEVKQSVASNDVDSFKIRAINTEKIIKDNGDALGENESNGWLKYTVYVNGCDFASSTITLNLGLGDGENSQKVTGYAFFDDVQVKKFISLDDKDCGYSAQAVKDEITNPDKPSFCTLTGEGDEKVFAADKKMRGAEDERYSTRFNYLIDLAADTSTASEKAAVSLKDVKTSAELTTEKSGVKIYASSKTNGAKIDGFTQNDAASEYVLPADVMGRETANDLLGIYGAEKTEFTSADFNAGSKNLSARLNSALTGEKGLGALSKFGIPESGSMLLMLSANGAAYTSTIEDDGTNYFTVKGKNEDDCYKILSLWVKTSDMNGKTAATVKLVDVSDETNTVSITVDTTDVKTTVGENEDIYSGWVQCFFFIKNESKTEQSFKIEFSFGNTSIVGTQNSSYLYGWAAMANPETLDVTEDVYNLASEGTYAKTFTFGEDDENTGNKFAEASSMSNVKKGVADPTGYNGVNGGSSYVKQKAFGDDYDRQNNKKGAISGLINKDGFESYDNALEIAQAFDSSITSAAGAWNSVFGEDCYQPLIIVNSLRTYNDKATIKVTEENFESLKNTLFVKKDDTFVNPTGTWEENKDETFYAAAQIAKNYGFIGDTQTLAASTYTTLSVKVKVSEGAVAYVYLVDPETYEVMNYGTTNYSFYYDKEGNVLSEKFDSDWTESEHQSKIVYTVRPDGLYKDKDGNLFANLYNLTKRFKFAKFENSKFYTADGAEISYDDLKDGETYYSNPAAGDTNIANHYLVVNEKRVYEYDDATDSYYYMVKGERGPKVSAFDVKYARFTADSEETAPKYMVKVENTDGKWVTVNFMLHSGDSAKDYRLELWSGERESAGDIENPATGAVAFDYSSFTVSESDYAGFIGKYEKDIIEVYKELLIEKDDTKLTADLVTIDDYKAALKDAGVAQTDIDAALTAAKLDPSFVSRYYSFSLYDSADYVPFNSETAEAGQTGYNYTVDDTETLTYFSAFNGETNSYNTFIDFSAVDQSYEIQTESTDEDEDTDETENTPMSGDGWLLITSIILVVALLFALVAILLKNVLKKRSIGVRRKNTAKNNYKQRERYIRKLGLVKNVEEPEEPEAEPAETPAEPEEAKPDEETAEPAETPAETAESVETPAEETKPEETPADADGTDDGKKE